MHFCALTAFKLIFNLDCSSAKLIAVLTALIFLSGKAKST